MSTPDQGTLRRRRKRQVEETVAMGAMKRTMVWGSVNAFVVVVHGKDTPTDEEWNEYLQFNLDMGSEHGVNVRSLAVTEGGAPTAAQRKTFHDAATRLLKKHPGVVRGAVVTPSTFVRGVVTAMSLVNPMIKAFSPAEMKECYAYMGVPEAYAGRVDALIASLKASLRELTSD
jgi:hypothetical protein